MSWLSDDNFQKAAKQRQEQEQALEEKKLIYYYNWLNLCDSLSPIVSSAFQDIAQNLFDNVAWNIQRFTSRYDEYESPSFPLNQLPRTSDTWITSAVFINELWISQTWDLKVSKVDLTVLSYKIQTSIKKNNADVFQILKHDHDVGINAWSKDSPKRFEVSDLTQFEQTFKGVLVSLIAGNLKIEKTGLLGRKIKMIVGGIAYEPKYVPPYRSHPKGVYIWNRLE